MQDSIPLNISEDLLTFRCKHCNKLIGKRNETKAHIEIKCLRCGNINYLLDDSHKQIFLTDSRGRILYANERTEQVTGYSVAEVVGKTPAIWGKQMTEEFYSTLWKNILTEKKASIYKITNKRKTGELYEVVCRISPILNDEGEVQFFLGISTTQKN